MPSHISFTVVFLSLGWFFKIKSFLFHIFLTVCLLDLPLVGKKFIMFLNFWILNSLNSWTNRYLECITSCSFFHWISRFVFLFVAFISFLFPPLSSLLPLMKLMLLISLNWLWLESSFFVLFTTPFFGMVRDGFHV